MDTTLAANTGSSDPKWDRRRISRDSLLALLGAGAFIHELVMAGQRPYLIAAALALMGFPAFIRLDEKRTQSQKDD